MSANEFEALQAAELRPDTPVRCDICGGTITYAPQHCITDEDGDKVICGVCDRYLDLYGCYSTDDDAPEELINSRRVLTIMDGMLDRGRA